MSLMLRPPDHLIRVPWVPESKHESPLWRPEIPASPAIMRATAAAVTSHLLQKDCT